MNYWQARSEASVKRYEQAVKNKVPEMIKAFEQAKKDIKKEVFAFYGRYAKNNGISVEEAHKALSRKELVEFKGTLQEFKALAKNSIGQFNLEVENRSMKARMVRLDALLIQIDARLQELYQTQKEIITETTRAVTVDEYYHAHYDISHETRRLFVMSKIPNSFVEQVLESPVEGMDISTRLWRQDMDTAFYVRQTLNRMFVEGRPPQDFAEELGKKIGILKEDAQGNIVGSGKEYEAYRLLYNESSYATGQARLKAFIESGVELYQISATLDLKTSEKCRSLDGCIFSSEFGGKVPQKYRKAESDFQRAAYEADKVIVGVNYPPFHVNCRTTEVPFYEEIDYSNMTRAARDPETGKTIDVPYDMTYQEWYSQYVENLKQISKADKEK